MTDPITVKKEEEEQSLVSISLGSEFLSLYTTQEDLWSRSDSFVTKSTFFNDINLQYYSDDEDSTVSVDIRKDIHQLWKQKNELEKALFEAKKRGQWTRPPLTRKQQLHQGSNLIHKQRKWDEDTCDRFQLRPIRMKTNDSILNGIAACREEIRRHRHQVKKATNDNTANDDKKGAEKHKPIRSQQSAAVSDKERRQPDATDRQPPRLVVRDEMPRSAGLVIDAMMWVSRSSWWSPGANNNVTATQIRVPPPNRRI